MAQRDDARGGRGEEDTPQGATPPASPGEPCGKPRGRYERRAPGHVRTSRRRARYGLAVTAVAAIFTAGCAGPAPVPPPPDTVGTQIDAAITPGVLDQSLVDQAGIPTSLAAYHGKVLIVSDIMTLCQETCPVDTATLVQTARAVERAGLGSQVEFLSITVDPRRDTPARLAAYRAFFAPAPDDWKLLTGSTAAISTLWAYLGVYYQRVPEDQPPATDWMTGKPLTYDVNHSDLVFFIDRDGHERFAIDGAGHAEPGTVLAPKLDHFLDPAGRDNLDHPGADTWTAAQALQVIAWLANKRIAPPKASP